MPGILPMKMIRVGGNTEARVAQACDRCRSKKIRCDGVRPCCTQCASVGFECKTSDRLSRRAFPRGYTESLEDRVRLLETEVRELKDLLDAKDEKIDMLSKLQNFSSAARRTSSVLLPTNIPKPKNEVEMPAEEFLDIQIPDPEPKTRSPGHSTTTSFIHAFRRKVTTLGKQVSNLPEPQITQSNSSRSPNMNASKIPPRLLSDQYINVYFQEWHTLLPIVHQPTFLKMYKSYIANPNLSQWHNRRQSIAQLFLIFDIAALSLMHGSKQHYSVYESQWRKALYACSSTACIETLQCHVLAQLYYLLKSDYTRLARHRGIAVAMCHELGLHQSQSYIVLPELTGEIHKRVFWCQYALDKFASAAAGTPILLRDIDISTELPADVDDENLIQERVPPALSGELTRISSALALFRVSRILSKTLESLYSSHASYKVSLSKLHTLSDELDQWSEELPNHLRLRFCNDKPATSLISDRSPLLSLAYFFTRNLIHRPIVLYGSGSSASAATIVAAAAGKHILQILDLLVERRMNYTFPISRKDLLLTAGFSVLWQSLELDTDSKLVKDNQKSLILTYNLLLKESQGLALDFRSTIVSVFPNESVRNQDVHQIDPQTSPSLPVATNQKDNNGQKQSPGRRSPGSTSQVTLSSRKSSSEMSPSTPTNPLSHNVRMVIQGDQIHGQPINSSTAYFYIPNPTQPSPNTVSYDPIDSDPSLDLDYLFSQNASNRFSPNASTTTLPQKQSGVSSNFEAWESGLLNFDVNYAANIYTSSSPDLQLPLLTGDTTDWTTESWPLAALDISHQAPAPQSILSFSEESLTSGDDLLFSANVSNTGSTSHKNSCELSPAAVSALSVEARDVFHGIAIPVDDGFE